jgi:hypothetical protein
MWKRSFSHIGFAATVCLLILLLSEFDVAVPLTNGADSLKLDALLRTRTAVVKGAPSEKGDSPLLIFGQGIGFESPISHTIMCEYLASHGYVVAACPLLGFTSPQVGNNLI